MCYSAKALQASDAAKIFAAIESKKYFGQYTELKESLDKMSPEDIRDTIGFARKPQSETFPWAPDKKSQRVYPGYFAPVITLESGNRTVRPMRYRVRPRGTPKEIPTKYNLFNCRLDSIDNRKTWKPLFGQTHALFPFTRFYEWVARKNKKAEIAFFPQEQEIMWAPALYDHWATPGCEIEFYSFALITDEPPKEVESAGLDR